MAQDICFTKRASVTAASSGKVSLGKLPKGYIYELSRVEVHLESGSAGDLEIALMVGDTKLTPDNGTFNSDTYKMISNARKSLSEGAELFVWYKNSNASTAFTYFICVDLKQVG